MPQQHVSPERPCHQWSPPRSFWVSKADNNTCSSAHPWAVSHLLTWDYVDGVHLKAKDNPFTICGEKSTRVDSDVALILAQPNGSRSSRARRLPVCRRWSTCPGRDRLVASYGWVRENNFSKLSCALLPRGTWRAFVVRQEGTMLACALCSSHGAPATAASNLRNLAP